MSANYDVSVLRLFLGEQSAAIWSDADLRNYVDLANMTVWKILSDAAPDITTYAYYITLGAAPNNSIIFPNAVSSVSSNQVIDATAGAGIGVPVSSVRVVYESKSPFANDGTDTYRKLKVKSGSGFYPVLENQNSLFNDLELPNLYQERMALFDYGTQSLTIHPAPSKNMTYTVELMTETPVYIKTSAGSTERTPLLTASADDNSNLLGVERFTGDDEKSVAFHAQQIVLYEAAYQASFVDKSLRREFAAERDRLLALVATPHTTSIDEAY